MKCDRIPLIALHNSPAMSEIVLEGVSKRYGAVRAVDGVRTAEPFVQTQGYLIANGKELSSTGGAPGKGGSWPIR